MRLAAMAMACLAPVAAMAADFVPVPVPRLTISAGEVLTAGHLAERRYRDSFVTRNGFARAASEVVGRAAARTLPKGRPIAPADLRAPFLVDEGRPVATRFVAGGLTIQIRLTALNDAGLGEPVRLRNGETGAIIDAVVTGPGTARVAP